MFLFRLLALFLTAFLCSVQLCYSKSDIEELFVLADQVKSSSTAEFEAILTQLSARESELSQEQTYFLKYLNGYQNAFKGNPIAAIEQYSEAYNGSNDVNLKVKSLTSIVNLRGVTRNFHHGYKEATELLPLLDVVSHDVRTYAYFALAIFYNLADENSSALEILKLVDPTLLDLRQTCVLQSTLLEAEHKLGSIKSPLRYEQAIESCQKAKEPILIGISTLLKSQHLVSLGQRDNAVRLLEQSEQIFISSQYPRVIAEFYASYAELLLQSEKLHDAIFFAEKSLTFTPQMQVTQPHVQAYRVLTQTYEYFGQIHESLKYYKLYAEAEKAFLDETKAKQLAIQQAKIESIEKNNKIALLDKENAILKAEALTEREEKLNTQLIAVILALLTIGTFVWARKNRRMHAMLRHKAQVDQLTNIANRSHFSAESERVIAQQSVLASPVSFIIFDLDFFKHVNDNHGHLTGDWVLEHTVKAVKPLLRNSDLFGRMGGEEFAILLSGCDAQQAISIAEKCRQAIENLDCSPSGALSLKVTASFGVSDSIQCGYSFDSLYGCADDALYKSKHAGRNDVYVYEPSFTSTPSSSSTSPTASPA